MNSINKKSGVHGCLVFLILLAIIPLAGCRSDAGQLLHFFKNKVDRLLRKADNTTVILPRHSGDKQFGGVVNGPDHTLLYPKSTLQEVSFSDVKIDDRFWYPKIRLVQTVTLPHLLDIAEAEGKIDNFPYYAWQNRGISQLCTLIIEDTDIAEREEDIREEMNTDG